MDIWDEIETAKRAAATGDYHLATYILRDLPEVEAAELDGLAWAMHRQGNVSKGDFDYLVQLLEADLKGVRKH